MHDLVDAGQVDCADAPAALAAVSTRSGGRPSRRVAVGWRTRPRSRRPGVVRRPLVIDVDATLATSHSEKESAAPTIKRGFGFHPL
jgi:hypothetical protein